MTIEKSNAIYYGEMSDVCAKIQTLFPSAVPAFGDRIDPVNGFLLRDDSDGLGSYIKEWNIDAPIPSPADLAAA